MNFRMKGKQKWLTDAVVFCKSKFGLKCNSFSSEMWLKHNRVKAKELKLKSGWHQTREREGRHSRSRWVFAFGDTSRIWGVFLRYVLQRLKRLALNRLFRLRGVCISGRIARTPILVRKSWFELLNMHAAPRPCDFFTFLAHDWPTHLLQRWIISLIQ